MRLRPLFGMPAQAADADFPVLNPPSRELNLPLYGGSSIPFYYRKPELELDIDTPIKASVVAGRTAVIRPSDAASRRHS